MAFDAPHATREISAHAAMSPGDAVSARPVPSPAARAFRAGYQLVAWAALGFVVLALLNTAIRG